MVRRPLAHGPFTSLISCVLIVVLGLGALPLPPFGGPSASPVSAAPVATSQGPGSSGGIADLSLTRAERLYRSTDAATQVLVVLFTATNTRPRATSLTSPAASATLRNVLVTDMLARPESIVTAWPRPQRDGDRLIWRVGDIAPGRSATATLSLAEPIGADSGAALDDGALAWSTQWGRLTTAQAATITLASAGPAEGRLPALDASAAPAVSTCPQPTAVSARARSGREPWPVATTGADAIGAPATAPTDCPSVVASPSTTPDPLPSGTADPLPSGTADPLPSGTADPLPSGTAPLPSVTTPPTITSTVPAASATSATIAPNDTPSSVPNDTPSSVPNDTPSSVPSDTATFAPTLTFPAASTTAPAPSNTASVPPSRTGTPRATGTASPTATVTTSPTISGATPTDATSPMPTTTDTTNPTPTTTDTTTTNPTPTRTANPTGTPSTTATLSPTVLATASPTNISTSTDTATASPSTTGTATASPTLTSTVTPTATMTNTATVSPTATMTNTATVSPTLTSTVTPTATISPTATPTNCAFKVAGWTFTPSPCPDLNTAAELDVNVTVTPPTDRDITVAGNPLITLSAHVQVDPVAHALSLLRPVRLPDVSLKLLHRFTLSITATTLFTDGLRIGRADLTMQSPTRNPCTQDTADGPVIPLGSIDNLYIAPDLTTSGGQITIFLYNAEVRATDVLLSSTDGFRAARVSLTMPPALGVRVSVSGRQVGVTPQGTVSGTIDAFDFTIGARPDRPQGALSGHVEGAYFGENGVTVDRAGMRLAIVGANAVGFNIEGFSYDGVQMRLAHADAEITLPNIRVGGVEFTAYARLSLTAGANGIIYHFIGGGNVAVPALGRLSIHVEIGSVTAEHPSNLYEVALRVDAATGIPIASTPFVLKGIRGGLKIEAGSGGEPVYTFSLGARIESAASFISGLFEAEITGVVTTDGDLGLKGDGTLLRVINGHAGLCIRLSNNAGGSCGDVITAHQNLLQGVGAYVEATGGAEIPYFGSLRLDDAYGALSGNTIAAHFDGSGSIAGISGQATGEFGRFRYVDGTIWGIKARVTGSFLGVSVTQGGFFGLPFHVALFSLETYTLIQPGGGGASLLPRLAGQAPANRLTGQTPANRLTGGVASGAEPFSRDARTGVPAIPASTITGAFRVVPGQTATFLTLAWRRGAPTLTLIAPDGRVLSLGHPGPDARLLHSANARALPAGTRALVGLYLDHPTAGQWQVRVGNVRGNEGFIFSMRGAPPEPTLAVIAPRRGQALVARGTRGHVDIQGTLEGAAPGDTVGLFYTAAPTLALHGRRLPNYAGALLAAAVPVHRGHWLYRWNTGALRGGRYYVYATLNNGLGPEIDAYGAGSVVVAPATHPVHPIHPVHPVRHPAPRRARQGRVVPQHGHGPHAHALTPAAAEAAHDLPAAPSVLPAAPPVTCPLRPAPTPSGPAVVPTPLPTATAVPTVAPTPTTAPTEYVADTGIFADRPSGRGRGAIDPYLADPHVRLYVPQVVVGEVRPTPSQLARLAGTPGGAQIVQVPNPALPASYPVVTMTSRAFGVNDMLILETARTMRLTLLTSNDALVRQVQSQPDRRRIWGGVSIRVL